MAMLVTDGLVPVFPTPVAHRGHCTGKTALGRDLPDHVLAVPRPPPDMGQAEEVEAGPIRFRMACALCHLWAEIDEACLVGMEREPKSCKTLAQDRQHAFGVDNIVERHDRIVGEPGKGAFPFEARPHLGLEPFVQHIVQKDVREAGRDHAPLRGTLGRAAQETVFDGPRLQPFVDHPSDNAVRDSLVEERPEVRVRNRIEILAYVDVDHPIKSLGNSPATARSRNTPPKSGARSLVLWDRASRASKCPGCWSCERRRPPFYTNATAALRK